MFGRVRASIAEEAAGEWVIRVFRAGLEVKSFLDPRIKWEGFEDQPDKEVPDVTGEVIRKVPRVVKEVVGGSGGVGEAKLANLVHQGAGVLAHGEPISEVLLLNEVPVDLASPNADVVGERADVDATIVIMGAVVMEKCMVI